MSAVMKKDYWIGIGYLYVLVNLNIGKISSQCISNVYTSIYGLYKKHIHVQCYT